MIYMRPTSQSRRIDTLATVGKSAQTPRRWRDQLPHYIALMRLNKPIGIFLLLWPTWWALFIAGNGRPSGWLLCVFTLGVLLMRSAGCVINDYADRAFDGHVRRTSQRPLVSGAVKPAEALKLFAGLIASALLLVLTTNTFTVVLAIVGAALAISYPFTKRYTHLPQFHLGLAFGWGIPMAFAAQTNTVPTVAWLLLIANVLWSVVYDTMYAMVDRDDDIRIGVKSTAILFGEADRIIIGILQCMMLATLWMVGKKAELGWPYMLALLGVIGLFAYHQYLIRDRQREKCFHAFLHNNWAGLLIFVGILLSYWTR
jgi:4-hydroxybenzoate polyprenyltransferase